MFLENLVDVFAINSEPLFVDDITSTANFSVPIVIVASDVVSATSHVFWRAQEKNIILLH